MTEESSTKRPLRQNVPLLIALGAIFGGLILLCMFAYLLLGPAADDDGGDGGDPTPTPFAATDPAGLDSGFVSVNLPDREEPVLLNQQFPGFLDIGNQQYSIQIDVTGPSGEWQPSLSSEQAASWVYGTVINYVLGVADTETNRSIMQSLQPGDELRITMKDGATLTYSFNSREITSRTNPDVFNQDTPGATVVLMGTEGEDRMVIRGAYLSAENTPGPGPGGGNAELGEPVTVGNVQATVLGATQLYDQPDAPPGFTFFVIDYEIRNNGSAPFDTSGLTIVLRDDLGNQYAASPLASRLGAYPALSGTVDAGQVTQASIGYALPTGLSSTSVYWVIADGNAGDEATVAIPFAGADGGTQEATVSLISADVSVDGTTLLLEGQVTNTGTEPVVVTESDVSLLSGGTVYLLTATNPAFPWVVPPGETLLYFVSFQRPVGAEAVFTVLNQSFQLNGLR